MMLSSVKVAVLAFVLVLTSCASIKDAGRTVGHTTRDVTKAVGHASRDAAKEIGHATRDVVKDIKDGG